MKAPSVSGQRMKAAAAGMPKAAKGDVFKALIRLLGYLKPQRARLTVAAFAIVFNSMGSIMISWFVKNIVDGYIAPLIGQQNPDLSGFGVMVIVMIAVFAVAAGSIYLSSRLMVEVSLSTQHLLREKTFAHMQRLPIRFYDKTEHGDLMSRFNNDIESVNRALIDGIPQFISSGITVVGVAVVMFFYNYILALVVLAMAGAMTFAVRILGAKSAKGFRVQQASLGHLNGFAEEMLGGQKVIKIFSREEQTIEDFQKVNEQLFRSASRANIYASILMPIVGNLGYMLYVILAILGSVMLATGVGELTVGGLIAFLMLSRSFTMPIVQLSQQFNAIIRAGTGAARIFEILDTPHEDYGGAFEFVKAKRTDDGLVPDDAGEIWCVKDKDGNLTELRGDVRVNSVDFAYEKDTPILNNISLYAKPGQMIAFVGSTGAGKTTIVNLLNRFYDVEKGNITYDGIDIREIKKGTLRRSIGVVLQDTNLFTGTIKDNIRFGRPEASDEDVLAAAKAANAHGFISKLPEGYDTVITENGSNLSQGQRQLLSIARVMLYNPPVIILDEATSSIDTRTEKAVLAGFKNLMKGKTVFVIAHRLSTIKNADAIIVLEHGEIIERGSHEHLLEGKGRYHQLYTGTFSMV